MLRLVLVAALVSLPGIGGDLTFTGNLQRVTAEGLTVRLADGSLVDAKFSAKGEWSAAAVVADYQLADKVTIRCKDTLELKQVRRVGDASPAEWEAVVTSISWREEKNLLAHPDPPAKSAHDPEGEELASFERARQVNLERVDHLPSFLVDEKVTRYFAKKGKELRPFDTIDAEVTFKNGEPARGNIRVNGKPSNRGITGIQWSVDFGTELDPVFKPTCPNTFRFDGRPEAGGRQVLAYGFAAPRDSCFGYAVAGARRYVASTRGRILVDVETGYLVQFEQESLEFPSDFPVTSVQQSTQWDDVKIGEATHLVPVGYELTVGLSNGDQWRIRGEFHKHRQFQASSDIVFQP